MTMRHFACGLATALAFGGPAVAQSDPVVVVELYTSQGCSSCPPADAYFADLVRDPSVIPLALHVDYWDYIGWADTFSMHKFTERQQAYARDVGSRTIYTPQMIVGGLDRVEGNNPTVVAGYIHNHLAADRGVVLTLTRNGDEVVIHAVADKVLAAPVKVQLVRYRPEETVDIERGENAGKTVTYHNIVTGWDALGDWSGAEPLEMTADVEGSDPVVVIMQEAGPAGILAAARLK
jgi:hypothetical protein